MILECEVPTSCDEIVGNEFLRVLIKKTVVSSIG